MLIDTHCHIDRFPNPMELAQECENQRITTVAVTNVPSHYSLAAQHIGMMHYVKPALGLHPLAVPDNMEELPLFLSLLEGASFVGEIGLDYSKEGLKSKNEQLHAFQMISEALSGTARFVTLHSRGSAEDVVDILEEYCVERAVFHWYSGTVSTLKRILDAGHYLSINTAMLSSKKGRKLLARMPRERILTETDGPYIKIGRKPAKPSDISLVLQGLSEEWDMHPHKVESQIKSNFEKVCEGIEMET